MKLFVAFATRVTFFNAHHSYRVWLILLFICAMSVESFAVPPPRVTDLVALNVKGTQLSLSWTVPIGTPANSTYEIRYSVAPTSVTVLNWGSRTNYGTPSLLLSAGTRQQIDIVGLTTFTTYCFAIRTRNPGNEISGLSNVVWVQTNGNTAKVELAWDAAVDSKLGAASSYSLVAEAVDDPADRRDVSLGNITTGIITGLSYGVEYEIVAFAHYPSGAVSSQSNTVFYTP